VARPRKLELVAEKAQRLHAQLSAAYRVLAELRDCLERLAGLEVGPVYAELVERRKSTRYGEYRYPVLQFCPGGTPWEGGCEEVYATRFREYAEALVEADLFARRLRLLAHDARQVLEGLEKLRKVLEKLQEFPSLEAGKVSRRIDGESDGEPAEEVAPVG